MSGDNKDVKNGNKEFSFIQEHIVPKKKSKAKKLALLLLLTVILAMVFGFVARIVFCSSEAFVNKLLGKEPKKEIITFPSTEPATEPKEEGEEERPKKEPESIIIEKTVEADVADYTHMYYKINEVAKDVSHSIVTVTSVKNAVDWFNNDYEITDVTCGLILKDSGIKTYILVSSSKIKETGNIHITFEDNVTVEAVLQGCDSDVGIAVLAVSNADIPGRIRKNMKVAKLGESYLLNTGDPIMALGSPTGYIGSMELGMVTNKPHSVYTVDNKLELFNTDINNNPNSEGVIVNMKGEIVGIITQKFKADFNANINTAISISKLNPMFEKMVNDIPMSYLGVIGADMATETAQSYGLEHGVYITQVDPKSPAFKAGIKSGDVILSIDESNVVSMVSLNSILAEYAPKETIKIKIKNTSHKDSKEKTVQVVLGTKK